METINEKKSELESDMIGNRSDEFRELNSSKNLSLQQQFNSLIRMD